jgi:hypothetical protein
MVQRGAALSAAKYELVRMIRSKAGALFALQPELYTCSTLFGHDV